MASRHEIISIDFRANAAKANPAMDSLRQAAHDMNLEIEKTKENIDKGMKTGMAKADLDALGATLAAQEKKLNSFNTAMAALSKGVGTLSRAIDAFNNGSLQNMSAAFQKASYNAAENAKKALLPGSKDYEKNMAELDALQQRNLENLAKYKLRTEQMLQSIADGGKISSQDLKQEADGIEELMRLLPHMGHEWMEYNNILQRVNATIREQADSEKRLKGAIVDSEDARREMSKLTKDGAEAARQQYEQAEQEIATLQKEREELKANRAEKEQQIATTRELLAEQEKAARKQEKTVKSLEQQRDALAARKDNEHDPLNVSRQNAETLRESVQQQTENLEQQKKKTAELDAEVNQLTEDIEKMGKTEAKPKVDSSEIEGLNAKLEGLKAKRAELDEVIKTQTELSDRYHSEFEELSKMPTPSGEMKKFEQAYAKFRDKMKSSLEQLPKGHFIPYNGYADTIGAADVRMMSRHSVSETDFKASVQRNLENARAYLYERAASFTDQGKSTSLDDLKFNLEQMKKLQGEYKEVLKNTDWKKSLYNEDGQSKQGVQAAIDYYKALIKEYESAIKQIETLEAKYKSALETPDNSDRMTELTEKSTEATNKLLAAVQEKGKVLTDITETEGKLEEATHDSATADDELAKKQEELTKKTEELNREKANQARMDSELTETKQKATTAQTDAIKAQEQELEKLNKELKLNKDYKSVEEDNITRNQGYYEESLKVLKEMGLSEKDITDQAKIQEAVEKKTLEIMQAEVNAEKEAAQQRREMVSKITSSQLGGSKADQEFYAKHAADYELSQYKDPGEIMERIAHLEMVSKLKNDKRFSDDTHWDPDDDVDEDELYVMTDEEKEAALNELRVLKQHIREELLKTLKLEGDIDNAVQEMTGGDGFSEDAKFGEQLNDKIQAIKEKIEEKIQTSLDKYDDIVNMEYSEAYDDRGRLDKDKVKANVAEYINDAVSDATGSKKNIEESKAAIEEYDKEIVRLEGDIKTLSETSNQQSQAQQQETQTTEAAADADGELAKMQETLTKKTEELNRSKAEENRMESELTETKQKAKTAEEEAAKAEREYGDAVKKNEKDLELERKGLDEKNKQVEAGTAALRQQQQQLADIGKAQDDNAAKTVSAEQRKVQAQDLTIKRMEDMIATLKKTNAEDPTVTPEKWQENERMIGQLTQRLEELKQKQAELRREPVYDMMTQRMDQLKSLSRDALAETRKFWEAMEAGADKNDPKLKTIEQNLKRIGEEEQRRIQQEGAQLLSDVRGGMYDKADMSTLDDVIKKLKAYQALIKDPEGTGQETFDKVKDSITDLSNKLSNLKGKAEEVKATFKDADEVLQRFSEHTGKSVEVLQSGVALTGMTEAEEKADAAARQEEQKKLQQAQERVKDLNEAIREKEEEIRRLDAEVAEAERTMNDASLSAATKPERSSAELKKEADEELESVKMQEEYVERLDAEILKYEKKITSLQSKIDNINNKQQKRRRLLSKLLTPFAGEGEDSAEAAAEAARMAQSIGESTPWAQNDEKKKAEYQAEIESIRKLADEKRKEREDEKDGLKEIRAIYEEKQRAYVAAQHEEEKLEKKELASQTHQQKMSELYDALSEKTAMENLRDGEEATAQRLAQAEQERANQSKEARRMKREELKEGIKLLEEEAMAQDRSTAEGQKRWEELNVVIKQMNQELKESTGEWMKLSDAKKLAESAGTDTFSASPQQIQQATQAIERQREALIKLIQQNKALGTSTDAEEKELADLTKKLRDLKYEADNFNMSQEKMQMLMSTPRQAVNLDELRSAIKRADDHLRRMEGSLGANSKEYKRFAEQVKQAKNVLKEMEGQAKATTSAFDKAWSRLKTYVGLYVGASVAMQKLTATMGDLMELSDKMGEVRKTTGFTADEVGRLTTNLKKMDVRTNLVQLLEISSSAGQLGLKTLEDVQGFTEAANKMMIALPEMGREAATEMMRVAIATGEVDKIRQQLEEGTVEGSSATAVAMEKIASTIDRLRASSASTAPEITDFVKRVGAVGAQSGITVDQIAALGSTVSSLGLRVEMSATALSRMIPAIRNNAYEIGTIIGKTEEDIKRRFAEGQGMSVIIDLFKAIRERSGVTAEAIENDSDAVADRIEKMMEASGFQDVMKELNQQGARAGIVFAGLSQNVEQLEYQLGVASEAYEENIAIQQEFDRMNQTTAAKWERLKNQFEEAFVGDTAQRWLGSIIDSLRGLVDFITGRVDGVLKGLHVAFLTLAAGVAAYKVQLGQLLFMDSLGGLAKLWKLLVGMKDTIVLSAMYTGQYIAMKWKLIWATEAEERATIKAKIAQLGLNKAMTANVFMAIATAILTAYLALKDWIGGSDAAKNAISDLNEKVDEEKRKLDILVNAYHDANGNLEKRKNLMNEINQKYSQYLGFLLTDAENSNLVALAHERIAAALQAEMYERERAQGESKVRQDFREDLSDDWASFTEELREYGLNAEQVAQARNDIQGFLQTVSYDAAADKFVFAEGTKEGIIDYMKQKGAPAANLSDADTNEIIALWVNQYLESTFDLNQLQLRDITGVGLMRGGQGWQNDRGGDNFRGDYAKTFVEMIQEIGKYNDDVNGAIGAANNKLEKNREKMMPELKQQAETAINTIQNNLDATDEEIAQAYENLAAAIEGLEKISSELPQIAEEEGQNTSGDISSFLTGLFTGNDRVDTQKVTDARARLHSLWSRINQQRNGTNNGDGDRDPNKPRGPYGNYDKRVDPYEQWDANALVARREEMLKRVRALAGGADVQQVLSMDKKFMDEATRKGIKNMRDAIAWYNEERLKIQEELHNRNLTNEGQWMDPKKGRSRKPKTPESEEAIAELDRYYLERKERIEEARANEEMTEAEYNRRLDALEQEHLQKRSDLRKTFTSEDKAFIQQFRQWWASVEELDEVSWETIEAEWIAAFDRDRKYNNRAAQKDLTAMQAITVKQLREIEAIIDKERPFNGITRNLQDNLTKMGILFKDGVDDKDFMEQNTKRLTFLLQEAEDAYNMTWEQLERDMRQNGLGAWADAIVGSDNADKEKRAIIAQLHEVYDAVHEAIKKEASLVKKQVDITWNDALLPNGKSIKQTYEAAISQLGVQQSSVSRANSLIGAGVASERVADRLALRQLRLQLQMQEHYYNLVRQTGLQRINDLREQARLLREQGKMNEADRLDLDAQHATMSLNLSLSKEQVELDKQREEIIARTEESQNRLYTALREWADLLSSSLQSVFEASHAGDAEYYNERAKLDLTGKGGPGAGTYVVIDNAGTSDATAHYEHLDERQALEREHEIEKENAQAEAWKKVMDDLNAKMNEQITDWMNAALQNASIDANTDATLQNTEALAGLTSVIAGSSGVSAAGTMTAGTESGTGGSVVPTEALSPAEVQEWTDALGTEPWLVWEQAGVSAMQHVQQTTADTSKKMTASTQSAFAKMTAAANLYGIAYQAMSNDNLSTSQKFQMMAVQAAGQAAISMLTANLATEEGKTAVQLPGILGKLLGEMPYPAAIATFAIVTGLLGGLMGLAVSKIAKSKSTIAQATGSSVGAGRLATGMLTYAEGNVNEFTDPASLTPGRQYNVDGADGKTYRARYMGKGAKTHITNGPEFHLVGEAGREAIIDAKTTRQIQMDEPGIWSAIQTLYRGGRVSAPLRRRSGRGMAAFADGNIDDFDATALDGSPIETAPSSGMSPEMMASMQATNDRLADLLEQALTNGIKAVNKWDGPDGIPNMYNKYQKQAQRHGERYL